MLELAVLRNNKDEVIEKLGKRKLDNASDIVEQVLLQDQIRRETQLELDQLLANSNAKAKQIGELMKSGQRDEAEKIKAETAAAKEKTQQLKEKLNEAEQSSADLLHHIPNIPHTLVPEGNTDEDNEIISEHGTIPQISDGAVPHWDLITKYDIIDFETGNKITGSGFPVYKGKGARLQRALISYFLDKAVENGYLEIQPPLVINKDSGFGTGQLPDKDGQMYHIQDEGFYLIPTAEVPITNIYRNEIIDPADLPVKNVGHSQCFRREAGSWGADVRGLNRLHQFDKVEIVQIRRPEESYQALDEMLEYVKSLVESLGLPFRVLRLCAGDLGFTAALTYDIEVFAAAQNKWLEVSSVSNFETYQANRLKLRFRGEDKKTQLLHTLNGSALALPRILAAILENNQTDSGIEIPEVLHKYCGFDKID